MRHHEGQLAVSYQSCAGVSFPRLAGPTITTQRRFANLARVVDVYGRPGAQS